MNPSNPPHLRRTILTLLTLLALAGCTPHMRGPIEPREDQYPWPQIMLADTDLPRQIAVRKPVVERDPAGLLFVTVPVRSTTRHEITIEYRSTFYDRNRTPIFPSTWLPVTMTPFTQTTISANSTSNRAEDFQIDIRRAK
jgi:uncharacterized protein YcfL